MVIIIKKGNKKVLKNYTLICLQSNIYTLLTKVLTKRLERTLDENQQREQAGFRSRYSTTDHFHILRRSAENIISHFASHSSTTRKPSTQTQAILVSLQEQWDGRCVHQIPDRNLYQQLDDTKKATRSTSGEVYDREISYRPSCSRQHSKAYSDD